MIINSRSLIIRLSRWWSYRIQYRVLTWPCDDHQEYSNNHEVLGIHLWWSLRVSCILPTCPGLSVQYWVLTCPGDNVHRLRMCRHPVRSNKAASGSSLSIYIDTTTILRAYWPLYVANVGLAGGEGIIWLLDYMRYLYAEMDHECIGALCFSGWS